MELLTWLTETELGSFCFTMLVSMVPVVELRGGLPFGLALDLPHWAAYLAAVLGNMLPVPFIVVYIRRLFQWLRRRMPRLNRVVDRLESKAHLKSQKVNRYKYLGLITLVAIPLPGTGAWTGALVAGLMDLRLKRALPAILLGVAIAGVLVLLVTQGVVALLW